jgi:ribosomal protein S18 acetylase RimI-like enzyme
LNSSVKLPSGYSMVELPEEEFTRLRNEHHKNIFADDIQIFRANAKISQEEARRLNELDSVYASCPRLEINLAVFVNGEFAAWSFGVQNQDGTFYMVNSAVLPAHRRKGVYSALLARTIEIAKEKGFQKIFSRHHATNNEVLIPKLKAGFKITGFEISDIFGTLVHLTLFLNPLREQVLDYRVGYKPSDEVKKALGL